MGALHAGHVSLIRSARKETGLVVVSIFVNPTQFGPSEDLDSYPRPLEHDREVCEKAGVDILFAPPTHEMYPGGYATYVLQERYTEAFEGEIRTGHFHGVCTVCAKLFNLVRPDIAFFGQKDYQQSVVIRRMVRDLNFDLKISVCPTVREPDGLAMSSRNVYLSPEEREQATVLHRALRKAEELFAKGERRAAPLIAAIDEVIREAPAGEGGLRRRRQPRDAARNSPDRVRGHGADRRPPGPDAAHRQLPSLGAIALPPRDGGKEKCTTSFSASATGSPSTRTA